MTIDARRGGAGDLLVALWIAESAKERGVEIKFIAHHAMMDLVRAFGFECVREPAGDCLQIAGGTPSYDAEMATAPADMTPRVVRWQHTHGWDLGYKRPMLLRDMIPADDWAWAEWASQKNAPEKRFVIISPQAHAKNREIPVQKLMRITTSLRQNGAHWMAISGSAAPVAPFHPFGVSGATWLQTIALMSMADLVIGADSGIAHLGATLGVKTIVVEGPTISEIVFGHALDVVHPIKSIAPCAGCYYHFQLGHQVACNYGCEAIETIPWFQIRDKAFELLNMSGSSSKPGDGVLPKFRRK